MSNSFPFSMMHTPSRKYVIPMLLSVALFMGLLPTTIRAEKHKGQTRGNAKSAELEMPAEENLELTAQDGVMLKATFYPGMNGKDTVPIVLLHMYEGSRKDYVALALFLQKQGHAVLVPDLRGHGDSTHIRDSKRLLDAKSMPAGEFTSMVTADMEACKKFLMEKNNAAELNIDKLCLVGSEMGCVVAMDYARLDWSWPPLVNVKQGQDVKALVLISPQWSFRSLRIRPFLNQPKMVSQIATMVVVGKQAARPRKEAERLYTMLTRFHTDIDNQKAVDRMLFYLALPTSLQGTKLLDAPGMQIPERIERFIEWRLVKQSFPWKKREALPTNH